MSWLSSIGDVLSPVGDFLSSNKSWLAPVGTVGLGLYALNHQKKYANQAYDLAKQQAEQEHSNAAAAAAAIPKINTKALTKGYKQAMDAINKGYASAKQTYQPYVNAGLEILPQQQQTYNQGVKNLSLLDAYLMTPENLKAIDQSIPAYNINVPLPDYLKR